LKKQVRDIIVNQAKKSDQKHVTEFLMKGIAEKMAKLDEHAEKSSSQDKKSENIEPTNFVVGSIMLGCSAWIDSTLSSEDEHHQAR